MEDRSDVSRDKGASPNAAGKPDAARRDDAETLLDFAVEKGIAVPDADALAIREAAGIEFERAYGRLALLMRPVTAATLRATEPDTSLPTFRQVLVGSSQAENWSRVLWAITVVVLLVTFGLGAVRVLSGVGLDIDRAADSEFFGDQGTYLGMADFCLPFLFGALGACAYLLRTCHWFIYQRTFDPLREPEYINRILLGLVSGGAGGLLFASYIVTAGETTEDLSAAAVGFLCGYNNDFLFTAIERLAAALLPKVPPPPPPPQTQTPTPPAQPPPETVVEEGGGSGAIPLNQPARS